MYQNVREFIKSYIARINPITGQHYLYRDITDEMIWDAAYNRRPDIVVCDSCKFKGGDTKCNSCILGNLFESMDKKEDSK